MVTIVDYGMGNLGSIQNMIKKVGGQSIVTSDAEIIFNAEKVLLPGVGSFDRAMSNLNDLDLINILRHKANLGIPFLGICLGMQLLADWSEEGKSNGLGIIPGEVKKFVKKNIEMRIPHMGWNLVRYKPSSKLFAKFEIFDEVKFYFVHSYHFIARVESDILATTSYDIDFTSSVNKGNVYGVQFHPEKSHKFGMQLMKNFVELI
jgi:glutamine amidotransferase